MNALMSILLYISLFSVSALIVGYGYKKKSIVIQIIGLLIPILLGGMRYNVGLDYSSYLSAYADIINPQVVARYDGTSKLEYSFYLISYISNLLFSSPIAVFVIYSAITVASFYRALTLFKPKKVTVSLFFFYSIFFLNSFNIMRQGAAVSLGCLALAHYVKGNRLKAFIYFLLAVLIHISALLLILLVAAERIVQKKYTAKKQNFATILIITVFISAGIAFVGLKIAAVGDFIYVVTGRIGDYSPGISVGVLFKFLVCLACLYLVIYVWRIFNNKQKQLTVFVAFGIITYSLGLVYNEAARFGTYLIALTPILLTVTFDNLILQRPKTKFIINIGVSLICISYIVAVHIGAGNKVKYNYQSVLMSNEYRQQTVELGI